MYVTDEVLEIINYVIDYTADTTDDWLIIKKELVNLMPPKKRRLFSRRHYSTKKHFINEFEKWVMSYWEEKTGTKLKIAKEKLHPKEWKARKPGWGLREYNEKRKKQSKARELDRKYG